MAPSTRPAAILPLTVRNLGLRFGKTTVLDGVSFDLGPSGCTMVNAQCAPKQPPIPAMWQVTSLCFTTRRGIALA